jgi:SAM-dependent methyltransferase
MRGDPSDDGWDAYLASYHHEHAGITELLLSRSRAQGIGTPYEWMREALPPEFGQVLDLACGSAPLQPLLSSAASYVGVDLSEDELAMAVRAGRGPLVRANAIDLPLSDSSVDTVLCSMGIMLLRPVEHALNEVARVLRPGGVFVTIRPVSVPVRLSDLRLIAPLLVGLRHLPEVPQRLGGRAFRRLLEDAGMTVVDDAALRFGHPLESRADALLVADALYLPHVSGERRADAARRLACHARAGAEVPVAIRRTVAVRS